MNPLTLAILIGCLVFAAAMAAQWHFLNRKKKPADPYAAEMKARARDEAEALYLSEMQPIEIENKRRTILAELAEVENSCVSKTEPKDTAEFPDPPGARDVLNLNDFTDYWTYLPARLQDECTLFFYRRIPWPDPQPSFLKIHGSGIRSTSGLTFIAGALGPGDYTISLRRQWFDEATGKTRKHEVCICNYGIS